MKKYISNDQRGIVNGVAPLNANKKIESQYLPAYTEIAITPNDAIADLSAKQTWSSEQTFNYEDYGLILYDNINGIAAGFKAPRGLFNQLFADDIVFVRKDNTATSGMTEGISFYTFDGVNSKAAVKDAEGNITTEGYNILQNYTKVFTILSDGGIVMKSPSGNYFKIAVDDNGTLSTTPYTYTEEERYEQDNV